MPDLVVLDAVGDPGFVDALRRAWDRGAVVLPVDPRLPPAARERLAADALAAAGALEPGDALVVATSGSTGRPKLVVHTRAGLAAHAAAVHHRLRVDRAGDRWFACLPFAHLGGLGVVVRSVLDEVALVVAPRPDRDDLADALRQGATLTSLVPTALDRADPAGWRWIVLGGAADPGERPANVVRTYGSTETGGGVVYDGVPLDGVEVRVGTDSVIALRGPTLARGLLAGGPAVEPLVDPDGWLATGDLGSWDGARLVVAGRADDLIVTGGENVWPAPVEDRLRAHPAVADVAVVGVADREWGRRVVALVVWSDDAAEPPSRDELRAHVRGVLPAAAAPRDVVAVAAVPRTALGKVRRAEAEAAATAALSAGS